MRVLIAHNRYRVPGGEERHVELLEQGLVEAGVEVRRFERDSHELEDAPLRRAATALTLAYRPGAAGIGRVLDEWRPDVVHFHNLWPLLTPSALRAARRRGIGVVLTLHNYRFACPAGTLLRDGVVHEDCIDGSSLACGVRGARRARVEGVAYGLALELQRRLRLLERWVDVFVAPSAFLARMLRRSGVPEQRVEVVPHGVPLSTPEPRSDRYALFTGRLSPEKGVSTLLRAAALAPDVPVVLAGSGSLAADAARTNTSVTYVGRLTGSAVEKARSAAAFAVVPSEWYEVLPFAAIEALAAGLPVVATAIGGLPEVVDDGVDGLLVPPRDAHALAEAMRLLWRDAALRSELGENARRIAGERFSLSAQTRRLTALYEAAAERSRRAKE